MNNENKTVSKWTKWMPIDELWGQGTYYRSNNKKVQVRFATNSVTGCACCNKTDDFNLYTGIHIAYLRCVNKNYEKRKHELEAELNRINSELAENKSHLKRMMNSL